MDNLPYVINMFVHIVAVILYAGGLFYTYILLSKRNKAAPDDGGYGHIDSFVLREPLLWLYYLIVIMVTGFGFGVISIILHGKPPDIAPIAFMALILMVIFSFISLAILAFLIGMTKKIRAEKDAQLLSGLRKDEENVVLALLIIVVFVLFCAVSLRFLA